MSVIKKYLPDVIGVIESIEQAPQLYYMNNHKVDVLIGSEEAINLTDEFIEAYMEEPKQDFKKITEKYK